MFSKSNKDLYDEMEKKRQNKEIITATDIDEMTRNSSDENMEMLLKYYEEKTGKDFFSDTNEQFSKKENIQEEINKAEEKEASVKVAGEDLGIDEQVQSEIEKEEEEKNRPLTENERLAILLKAQFLANLERYTANVLKAQNAQIAEHSFAMEDKINTRVVLERAYGDSRAVAYKNVTGESLMNDPQVKEAVESCQRKLVDGNKVINRNMEKDIAQVKELEDKIQYLKEKISELSANANSIDNNDFELQIEHLSKELNDTELELRALNPDDVDLKRNLEIEERNNEFEDRITLGYKNSIVPSHELASRDAREMKDGSSNKDEIVEDLKEENYKDNMNTTNYTVQSLDNIEKLLDNATTDSDIENIYLALQSIDNSISIEEFKDIQEDTGVKASNSEIKEDRQKTSVDEEKEFNDEVASSAQDRKIIAAKDCLREHLGELRERLNVQKSQIEHQEKTIR